MGIAAGADDVWWIVADVADGSAHIIGVIEKHCPAGIRPNGVIIKSKSACAQQLCTGSLEVFDHVLCQMSVLADE